MVDSFLKEKIVDGMIKLREKYGMYAADEYEPELEDIDMSMGADGQSRLSSPSRCSTFD